jgi:ATP-dependent Clp protease ATP-binding subunit ClpC
VLAPIALTIVEHRFLEGDQFLFIRSNGKAIEVEFVDPDAERAATPLATDGGVAPLSLQSLVLAPTGTDAALAVLVAACATLSECLQARAWRRSTSLRPCCV